MILYFVKEPRVQGFGDPCVRDLMEEEYQQNTPELAIGRNLILEENERRSKAEIIPFKNANLREEVQ